MLINNLELNDGNIVSNFVNSQISKMPDYFRFSVKLISFLFEIFIFLRFFKRFYKLKSNDKVNSILFIKKYKIPILSLLIRLVESNALIKYYELYEKE
tara:strand:- start:29 stop:322 length:294 start_codon:yes stop_codon:yes gene_type:complete